MADFKLESLVNFPDLKDVDLWTWSAIKAHILELKATPDVAFRPWYVFWLCRSAGHTDMATLDQLLSFDQLLDFDGGCTSIDPRQWFGKLTEEPCIPEELCQYMLSKFKLVPPHKVVTYGRMECQIPTNWHEDLVYGLIKLGYRVDENQICRHLLHPNIISQLYLPKEHRLFDQSSIEKL